MPDNQLRPEVEVGSPGFRVIFRNFRFSFKRRRHDVFLAVPMATLKNAAEADRHKEIVHIARTAVSKSCKTNRIFYAGDRASTRDDFDPSDQALAQNRSEMSAAKSFLMILELERRTSVLVEAGMALGLGRPSLYMIKSKKNLPYLLREAGQASRQQGLPLIRIHQYSTDKELAKGIEDIMPSML